MLKGQILYERYQIIRKIGGGGMADVYLATDIILQREVAIKILRLEYANDVEFIERFDREAKAATSLSHPNIVNIFDVGEEENIFFMVMEYVDGFTLKEYIQEKGPLGVEESITIMKQLTDAIAHAHANGLIHRDIKPQNILIDKFGNVKITDFGIAIALSATSLTQTNSIVGSVHYLSPEQARGGVATKKSDIYSLGIVMYELLTGELAFTGESAVSIALKHLQNEIPSVRSINPEIPQSVENIILKATTKDSFNRYNTVFEMEEALNIALEPSQLHQEKFVPPSMEGDETKVIPVITDEQMNTKYDQVEKKNTEAPVTPEPKKKKKKKKPFYKSVWFYVSLAVLLVIGLLAFFILQKPKEIAIPDVIEWEFEEAEEELLRLKFKVVREDIYSEDIAEGLVVKTDPRAGRVRQVNSEVTVFVSQGMEKTVFDNYVGQDFDEVKRLLIEIGYDEDEIIAYEKTSDSPVGEILEQVQPLEGEEVIPGETTVIFEISKGPDLITLNNLRGLTVEEATKYLDSNQLKIKVDEAHSDTVGAGLIIEQDPGPAEKLTKGDTVSVVVSLGKKELPPRSHSVTFVVPFEPKAHPVEVEPGEEDEGQEPKYAYDTEQTVQIYVDDLDHSITDVFKEEVIKKDTEYTLTLVIAPDTIASYRVVRDGEQIREGSVPFRDGE